MSKLSHGKIVPIVMTAVLFIASVSWCAPPGDKVADSAYNQNVQEIQKQLAETFPLMALIELQVIEILLESSADVGFFYQLISNEPGQEGQIGRIRESDIDFRVLSSGDPGLRMTGIFKETSRAQINAAVEALADQRRIKIWAEPSILTLLGQEAAIQSGDEIPYIRRVVIGNAETISSQFQPTGVSLRVTPTLVEEDGFDLVRLKLFAEVSTVTRFREEEGYRQPITDRREYESTIVVSRGDYVSLGGLYRRVETTTRRGIPGVQSIPLIGWAAQGSSQRFTQSLLVVLIRPLIVNVEETGGFDLEKLQELSDEQRPMQGPQRRNGRDWVQPSLPE